MSTSSKDSEKEVKECIELLGFKVQKIKEGPHVSPDFWVECENYTYLVELKDKFTDSRLARARDEMLNEGRIVEETYSSGRKRPIFEIVRRGCEQLRLYEPKADFGIIWLHAKGHIPDFQIDDFENSLFGCEPIVDFDGPFSGYCYYFGHSDFFRHRDILDAAVVSTDQDMKLCLNTCSSKYSKFKKSKFADVFLSEDAVIDPIEKEKSGEALIVDSDVDRKDEIAVMEYISEKYALKRPMKMNLQQIAATAPYPLDVK